MSDTHDTLPHELRGLLAALREGTLDEAQAARLEQLVRDDPAARRAYVEYQHMIADLRWLCGGVPRSLPPAKPTNPSPLVEGGSGWRGWVQGLPWIDAAPIFIFGGLMLAAGLMLGMRLGDARPSPSSIGGSSPTLPPGAPPSPPTAIAAEKGETQSPPSVAIATLAAAVDCDWETGSLPTHAGARLSTGTLRLNAGIAQLDYDSGARVVLQGPAVFEVTATNAGLLSVGQLVARVSPAAVGFTIRTPSAAVVDLGTEFGVIAEARGATEVHVFDGLVELNLSAAAEQPNLPSAPITVAAGQARRLEAQAEDERAAANWIERPLDTERFTRQVVPSRERVVGDLLLADDFTGEKLDRHRWRVITEGIRSPEAKIQVVDGRVELSNRAHLVTREEYDPAKRGGLRIRGRWTFASENDLLQILTRSDGVPNASANGDTQNGVEFIATTDQGGVMGIYGRGDAQLPHAIALIPIQVGNTFDFEILDDGQHVSFTLTEVGGAGATATVATECDIDRPTDFIVFHNRERGRQSRSAWLERVTLEGNLRPNPALQDAPAVR
ncbi:MAG: FecR domain-containing protein [Pirellulales bacterium]|nr:FecR domain-containing protein [Pirellulales bacterium]